MGRYTARPVTTDEYKLILKTLREGYELDGVKHGPDHKTAAIMVMERNLGMRLSDIIRLKRESIVYNGFDYQLNVVEKKTGKGRYFIVNEAVKKFIDDYADSVNVAQGMIFKVTEEAVWKAMRNVTKYLKMKDVNTHSIRKLAGLSIYKSTGYDLEAVRAFYQHKSLDVTQRYLRITPATLRKAINDTVDLG